MKKNPTKLTDIKRASAPLIVEPHPKDYSGFPFITLIQYRKQPMLTIIDNADDVSIRAFVLDLCGPENVSEEIIIRAAADWYVNDRGDIPLSVAFSQRGMAAQTSRIYRSLNVDFISRVIGPVSKYPMAITKSIKRRRRKTISNVVEIRSIHLPSLPE